MRHISRDIRFALRSFARTPLFTAVIVLSLALGIGANTAIFTLTDQILLRLLPVKNPRELVQLTNAGAHVGNSRGTSGHFNFSYPMFKDMQGRASSVFTGLMARFPVSASVRVDSAVEFLPVEIVSGNYFEVLGVTAVVGRTFTPDDDRSVGAHPLAVISYNYWNERFKKDPAVVGKTIYINSNAMTVIGVSQQGFLGIDGTAPTAVRVPMVMKKVATPTWDELNDRRSIWLHMFGRLKPGVSREQALARLAVDYHNFIAEETQSDYFDKVPPELRQAYLQQRLEMQPAGKGFSTARGRVELPLRVLTVLVGVVLLIACANVAGLLVARGAARRKEIAVRLSMGASRFQLLRQLLVESTLLSLAGGALGIFVSVWCTQFLTRYLIIEKSTVAISTLPDARILLFTAAVSFLTGILFGFVPAWQATRVELSNTLKDQAGNVAGGRAHVGLRKGLVIAQVGLSLLLLVGAGLFVRSLVNLRTLHPGFQISRVVAFSVNPSLNGYNKARELEIFRRLTDNIRGLPGVENVSLSALRILSGDEWNSSLTVEGYVPKSEEDIHARCNAVSKGYFNTLGVPMLAGRDFDERDAAGKWKVVVVNRAFAESYLGGINVIGRRIALGAGPQIKPDTEIVGVAANAKYLNLKEAESPQVFWPYERFSEQIGIMNLMVRTKRDPETLFRAFRAEVSKLDPGLPVTDMRTLEEQRDLSLVIDRLLASLAGAFGVLATLLASLGLYGVLAYVVQSRTREIGIRMALGAEQSSIAWIVVRDLLLLVGAGAVLGLASAFALSRFVGSALYNIKPVDPLTFGLAVGVLTTVAALAGLIPSLRAARVDPIKALRYE